MRDVHVPVLCLGALLLLVRVGVDFNDLPLVLPFVTSILLQTLD